MIDKTFGERLRAARTAKELTRNQLSGAAGVSTKQIYFYETGTAEPRIGIVVRLAKALGVSVEWLIGEKKIQPFTCATVAPCAKIHNQILL